MQDKNTPSLDPHINQNFITDIHAYIHIYSTCPHMAHIYCLTSERALKRVQDLLKSLVMAKGHLRQLGGVSEDDVQRENELQEHKRYLFSTVYIVCTNSLLLIYCLHVRMYYIIFTLMKYTCTHTDQVLVVTYT